MVNTLMASFFLLFILGSCGCYYVCTDAFVLKDKSVSNHHSRKEVERSSLLLSSSSSSSSSGSTSSTSSCKIATCASNIELQRAISFYVNENDFVLEFGSQLSDTTKHLCRTIGKNGKATLVDIKRSTAKSGRNKNRNINLFVSNHGDDNDDKQHRRDEEEGEEKEEESFADRVTFIELEQLNDWKSRAKRRLLFQQHQRCYDVMILDIGSMIGNDLYLTTLSLVYEILSSSSSQQEQTSQKITTVNDDDDDDDDDVLKKENQSYGPRVIIVKSTKLCTLARRLVNSQRLLDEKTTELPPSIERSSEPYMIACVGVEEYRKTIPYTIRKGDCVLEVGCHFGRTTDMLHNAAASPAALSEATTAVATGDDTTQKENDSGGYCIGVDIGKKIISNAKKQYPHITFEVADAWKTLQLLQMKIKKEQQQDQKQLHNNKRTSLCLGYDIVYADIGGLSGSDGLLESLSLLDLLGNSLEPRCIVIKSLCVKRLSSNLVAFSDIWTTATATPATTSTNE